MGQIERNPQTGKIVPKRFTMGQIKLARRNDGGFCLACGAEAYGVEPDARKYQCEQCEFKAVYGAEEIAIMGLMK